MTLIVTLNFTAVPLFLQYEITYDCQSHCIFCYNPLRNSHPSIKLAWKIAKKLYEEKMPSIQITGGECTTFSETNKVAKYLSEVSGVTIVTNAIKKSNFPSEILALFISLHGMKKIHEKLTNNPGTYKRICKNIKSYKKEGFDISADTILTSKNFNEIYKIAEKACELEMDRVYINRFEPGGIGSKLLQNLMPSISQFRNAVTQIIDAKNDLGINILFGTSIPFCIDERLIKENLTFSCGAGTWFAAVDPFGNLRICNQAKTKIGNILDNSLEKIWNNKKNEYLSLYRNLKWVKKPCSKCPLLVKCICGCRIDNTCEPELCIDSYMRKNNFKPDFSKLSSFKPKKRKVTFSLDGLNLNTHIKIVERKNRTFLVNPEIGVCEISEDLKSVIKHLIKNKFKISDLNYGRISSLIKLGVLIGKLSRR